MTGYGERIGIIGAMNEEIERISNAMQLSDRYVHAGIEFYEGTWTDKTIVLCKSGVGKVNAAVCTQILIDRCRIEAILFTGVAGAVDPRLHIGDIVISTTCIQHDIDATALGFERGQIPFQDRSEFAADEQLVELASVVSEQLYGEGYMRGKVLSGDQFIANREHVRKLYEEMGGACTEMEGAAVAQVCAMNDIPFVIIRSMSDKADGSAHENFTQFTVEAADRSYHIIEGMLRRM